MNTKPLILRVAAVVCSLLLLGGYIYERAVGGMLPKWRTTQPTMRPKSDDPMLPGSKSALVDLETEQSQRPVLGGSKSKVLIEPQSLAPAQSTSRDDLPATESETLRLPTRNTPADSQRTILPGSKSVIIAEPAQAGEPQPQEPRTLLPGSKSEAPILRTAPPEPQRQQPVQQPRTSPPIQRPR